MRKKPQVSSSLHPTLAWGLNHPEDRGRFRQTSARPARRVQVLGSGVQGPYLLLHSSGKGAGRDIDAVSGGHILPTGCAPHLNGQVVLDAGHQLGMEGRSGSGVLEDHP